MSDNPKNPTLSNERESPSRRFLAEMRGVMSATGNQRSKPVPCDKALPPLIARYGFDALLVAAKGFYTTPQARKDGGEFQPGLQVIANDGRLEAAIEAAKATRARAIEIFEEHGFWDEANGPRPEKSQGANP